MPKTSDQIQNLTLLCPDCHAPVLIARQPQVDDIIICDSCGAEIRLTAIAISYETVEEEK